MRAIIKKKTTINHHVIFPGVFFINSVLKKIRTGYIDKTSPIFNKQINDFLVLYFNKKRDKTEKVLFNKEHLSFFLDLIEKHQFQNSLKNNFSKISANLPKKKTSAVDYNRILETNFDWFLYLNLKSLFPKSSLDQQQRIEENFFLFNLEFYDKKFFDILNFFVLADYRNNFSISLPIVYKSDFQFSLKSFNANQKAYLTKLVHEIEFLKLNSNNATWEQLLDLNLTYAHEFYKEVFLKHF